MMTDVIERTTEKEQPKTYTLYDMRKISGIKGAIAAKLCGTTYHSLRNWEKGETIPNIIHIHILLDLYGFHYTELDLSPFYDKHQERMDKHNDIDVSEVKNMRNKRPFE